MSNPIPKPVVEVIIAVLAGNHSHADLNRIFGEAGAPGDMPEGPRHAKVREWLKRAGEDKTLNAHVMLGKVLEQLMEVDAPPDNYYNTPGSAQTALDATRKRVTDSLAKHGLKYEKGGFIRGGVRLAARSFEEMLRARDLPAVEKNFEDAVALANTKPEDAVGKACSMLESVFRFLIEASEPINLPAKGDLPGLWKVVRGQLHLDPLELGKEGSEDLKTILGGLASVAGGIGSLRTHESTAHGKGSKGYNIKPRHARVAVHAASTLAVFLIETWEDRNQVLLAKEKLPWDL